MRLILQLCLMVLLGMGNRAWGKVTSRPQTAVRGFVEYRWLGYCSDAPPSLMSSGGAAAWGREIESEGHAQLGYIPTMAKPVVVTFRGVAVLMCPSSPPPFIGSFRTTNPVCRVDAEVFIWLSKDPIGIRGGINLYGMCGNDPVNQWDNLGKAVQSFSATTTGSYQSDGDHRTININITAGVHWACTSPDARSQGALNVAEQKQWTKKIESFWSKTVSKTKWKKLPGGYFTAQNVDYVIKLSLTSTHEDAGDKKPARSNVFYQITDVKKKCIADDACVNKISGTNLFIGPSLWRNERVYYHEFGHLLGLLDYYSSKNTNGVRTGGPLTGWGTNIMGTRTGEVDYRNAEELIIAHYGSVYPADPPPGTATPDEAEKAYEDRMSESAGRISDNIAQ